MGNRTFIVIVILALGVAIYTYFFLKKQNEEKYKFIAPERNDDWKDNFAVLINDGSLTGIYEGDINLPTIGGLWDNIHDVPEYTYNPDSVDFQSIINSDTVDGSGNLEGTEKTAEEGW